MRIFLNPITSVDICITVWLDVFIGEKPRVCSSNISSLYMYRRKSEYLSIPKNNGDEAPKGPSPIIVQEWTDTRTSSGLKYTSTEI